MQTKRAVLVPCYPSQNAIVPECRAGLANLAREGWTVRTLEGQPVDVARCMLATAALDAGCEELLFVDADVGFDPADAERLRWHGLPLVCGLYAQKRALAFACNFMPGSAPRFGPGGGLLELVDCGLGFALVRAEVCREIIRRLRLPRAFVCPGVAVYPLFLPAVVPSSDVIGACLYLGEDRAFCYRARLCGFDVVADTTIALRHWAGDRAFSYEDVTGPGGLWTPTG